MKPFTIAITDYPVAAWNPNIRQDLTAALTTACVDAHKEFNGIPPIKAEDVIVSFEGPLNSSDDGAPMQVGCDIANAISAKYGRFALRLLANQLAQTAKEVYRGYPTRATVRA